MKTVEQIEQDFWVELDVLETRMRNAAREGNGSPAIRDAADAIRQGPQQVLERERGRRQLRDIRYASDPYK